jgi:hypothetical protein
MYRTADIYQRRKCSVKYGDKVCSAWMVIISVFPKVSAKYTHVGMKQNEVLRMIFFALSFLLFTGIAHMVT